MPSSAEPMSSEAMTKSALSALQTSTFLTKTVSASREFPDVSTNLEDVSHALPPSEEVAII